MKRHYHNGQFPWNPVYELELRFVPASVSQRGAESGARRRDDIGNGAGAERREPLADGSKRICVFLC